MNLSSIKKASRTFSRSIVSLSLNASNKAIYTTPKGHFTKLNRPYGFSSKFRDINDHFFIKGSNNTSLKFSTQASPQQFEFQVILRILLFQEINSDLIYINIYPFFIRLRLVNCLILSRILFTLTKK